jgi:hypothetical protein
MKKILALLFLAFLALPVFAQTSYRDQCRQVIYAVRPVESVAKLSDATLRTLTRFALGMDTPAGQEALAPVDAELFGFLGFCESKRRTSTADAFSLFLQEQKEQLQPRILGQGDTTRFIKMDSWIDIFRLNLMFD